MSETRKDKAPVKADIAPDADEPGDDTISPELEALFRPDDPVVPDEVDQPDPGDAS